MSGEASACNHAARRATFSRGVDRWNGMWRVGVYSVSSGAQSSWVKTTVVCWATAESSATSYGADHDRMTGVHSRSS